MDVKLEYNNNNNNNILIRIRALRLRGDEVVFIYN
jgi:hypothetical protein